MLDDDPEALRTGQYGDPENLAARAGLHERFSTAERPWFRWIFDHLHLPADADVLEVGCGPGTLWADNAERIPEGWDLVVTDLSGAMVREARETLEEAGVTATLAEVDVRALPFDQDRFDAVVANHCLYHVPDGDRDGAIGEIARVLAPDGRLYATTNGRNNLAALRECLRAAGADAVPATLSFDRENGAGQLEPWFPALAWRDYDDGLAIDAVDPVIAYARSLEERLDEDALRAAVERRMEPDGTFRVGKEQGLFVATRESWSHPRPAARALIERDGAVLLVRQGRSSPRWILPGGGITSEETPREAVIREVREETGLDVEPTDVADAFSFPVGGDRGVVATVFSCRVTGGDLDVEDRADPAEPIDDARWVEPDDFEDLDIPSELRAVLERTVGEQD